MRLKPMEKSLRETSLTPVNTPLNRVPPDESRRMTSDNRELERRLRQDSGQVAGSSTYDGEIPVDFAFLDAETLSDQNLQHEVLALFVAQARRLVPTLPGLTARRQFEMAHLLKGSARGIGAWPAAAAAEAYEQAAPDGRGAAHAALVAAFAIAETAIEAHLARAP